MTTVSYWSSLLSGWLPWLQPKMATRIRRGPLSYSSFTGSRKAVERYLGPTLHRLAEEAMARNPRRCQRCNSGQIDPLRRKAIDSKAVIEAALELHRAGDLYFVNLEQLEQHIGSQYKERITASPMLCKECLRKRQQALGRESYQFKFPDLSVYKTPELKLGPNLSSPERPGKPLRQLSQEGSRRLRVPAWEFKAWQEMKIGELVQKTLPRLLETHILSDASILELQDALRSKLLFDVNFPVLLKFRDNDPELGRDKYGHSRYYRRPVRKGTSKYLLTSQWYKASREPYLKWLRGHIVVGEA